MKAIIMAGGEGSRLRPLTCDRPKPLTPILNRPVMEYIIQLLKQHGVREIGVTLQYLPEAIKDYFGDGSDFGVKLKYFVEDMPLGTAGSVKNAESFLDEPFLVVSGDALTDFDLSQAIDFHQEKGSLATLVLTKVNSPLEYGVVITDSEGHVKQFLEKPSWGEVFSDKVNTGIYVFEPEVLSYIPANKKFDFSQDLFPFLLKTKQAMFGCTLPGYWCDIGNLVQYAQAQYDLLAGKLNLSLPATEIRPQVYVDGEADIHKLAELTGPIFIGRGAQIGAGAKLEPFTIIGNHCVVDQAASLKRSILWDHVRVGQRAQLRGAVLCNRVKLGKHSQVYEGAVIGDDCVVRERSIVKPQVKLWPNKSLDIGVIASDSLIWGQRQTKNLFGWEGVGGIPNVEFTPELAVKLGAAYANLLGATNSVLVTCDCWSSSLMLKSALISGLLSGGLRVFDGGTSSTPITRLLTRDLGVNGGVHIKHSSVNPDGVVAIFIKQNGSNISKSQERKMENWLAREDMARVPVDKVDKVRPVADATDEYLDFIQRVVDTKRIAAKQFKVVFGFLPANLSLVLPQLLAQLGCQVTYLNQQAYHRPRIWQAEDLADLSKQVVSYGADLGVMLDDNGERLILIDDTGQVVDDNLLLAIISLITFQRTPGTQVTVPITAPSVIEQLAERYSGEVVRAKTATQVRMEQMLAVEAGQQETDFSQFLMNFDAMYALAKILEYLTDEQQGLGSVKAGIPQFYLSQKEIPCAWEAKGKVMRELIENHSQERVELLDGIKVFTDEGWALILPDTDKPICKVYGEGPSMEVAEELTNFYIQQISEIQKN